MQNEQTDLGYLEGVCKGDAARMQRYINMYLEGAPTLFDQMEQALEAGNSEELSRTAHSLKPQATYMGAEQLLKKLQELEKKAIQEGASSCKNELAELLAINRIVIGELRSSVQQWTD